MKTAYNSLNSPYSLFVIITACFSCFSSLSFSQQSAKFFDPKEYNIPDKQLIFEDNFNDDRNQWLNSANDTRDSSKTNADDSKINNGMLICDNRDENITAFGINTSIDFNKNFEIEYSVLNLYTQNKHREASVAFWGRDSLKNATYIYTSPDSYLFIADCPTNNWKDCKTKGKNAKNYQTDTFNKVTIRHMNQNYYLFLNGIFQKAFTFRPLAGNTIGLGAGTNCTMVYDYIKIYSLP